MSQEPTGESGEAWEPPTEDAWLEEAVTKAKMVIKKVQESIPGAHQVTITRTLVDKLISPYHYYCENQRKEWMTKWARLSRNRGPGPKPEKKSEGKGTKEAPGPETVDKNNTEKSPHGDATSLPAKPSKQETSTTSQSGASSTMQTDLKGGTVPEPPYVNMPMFRAGVKGEIFAVCPKCEGGMDDLRPDPTDPASRTQPNERGTRKPDFKCLDPECDYAIWLNTPEEAKRPRGSAARARKEAEKMMGKKR